MDVTGKINDLATLTKKRIVHNYTFIAFVLISYFYIPETGLQSISGL